MALIIGSDNLITLSGLKDNVSGNYINNATVTAVVQDQGGNTVGSISLPYVGSSNGNYQGNLPNSTTLNNGVQYSITVTATSGSFVLILVNKEFAANLVN